MDFVLKNRKTVFSLRLVLLFQLIFSSFLKAQTFTKDRFVAKNGAVVWTETIEIKDMDTPVMVETLTESLRQKHFIQLDSMQQRGVLSGIIIGHSIPKLSSARFRVDFLYESYIVAVSEIRVENRAIERELLRNQKEFMAHFSKSIQRLDEGMYRLFTIGH